MTMRAIGRHSLFCELVLMIVGVTVSASAEFQNIGQFCFMTGIAGDFLMFPFQLVTSLVMIEILHALYDAE